MQFARAESVRGSRVSSSFSPQKESEKKEKKGKEKEINGMVSFPAGARHLQGGTVTFSARFSRVECGEEEGVARRQRPEHLCDLI